MCSPAKLVTKFVDAAGNVIDSTVHAIENIAKDPLPIIETVALTYALGPAGAGLTAGQAALVTSAAISAANGGKVEDIALNAAAAYAGGQIGEYAGASMPPETTSMVRQVVTSASASAATTALRGGDFNQILASGVSGSVNGYVTDSLRAQGFTNVDNRLIASAAGAATNAILNGRSISDALAQSVTASVITAAIQGQVDQLNKNNELGQSIASQADSLAKQAQDFYNKNLSEKTYNYTVLQRSTRDLNISLTQYNGQVQALESDLDQYNHYASLAKQDPNDIQSVMLANGFADSYQKRLDWIKGIAPDIDERRYSYEHSVAAYNKAVDEYTAKYATPLAELNAQYETLVAQTTELSTSLADNVIKYQADLQANSGELIEQIGKQAVEEATKLLTPPVAEVPPVESETPVTDTVATTEEPLPPYEPTPEEPVTPEPTPVEPEPTPVEPEPTPVEPEPTPVEPMPVEPTPVEPMPVEPMPVEPEPTPVEPEPTPVEPTPVEPEPTPVEPTPEEPVPADTRGYYDEITGKYIYDPNGTLAAPLDETSGTNLSSMDGYTYDPVRNVWTMPDGTVVDLGYLSNTRTPISGSDLDGGTPTTTPTGQIRPIGGTPTRTPTPTPTPTPTLRPATPTPQVGETNIAALLATLAAMNGGTSQQPQQPQQTGPQLVDIGEQLDLGAPLETNPFAKQQTQTKMAQGGSIDDLLALLRRG